MIKLNLRTDIGMGCDIHVCIEYQTYRDHWWGFGGVFNPGRNYLMFEAMAGARGEVENAVCPPKGLPEKVSYQVRDRILIPIGKKKVSGNEVTIAQARRWESAGHKIIFDNGIPVAVEHPDWHTYSWLTTKEFGEALDLFHKRDVKETQERNEMALSVFQKDVIKVGRKTMPKLSSPFKEDRATIYHAIHDVMSRLEVEGIGVRLVFWFDN